MTPSSGLAIFALASLVYARPNTATAPGAIRPDGAYQLGPGVSRPSVVFRTNCEIPELARKLRAQGEVALSLVVKADGSVRDVQVVRSAGYGMDERAADCVRKWRFKPGEKDGSPVDVASQLAYSFGLTPEPRMWGAGPLTFAVDNGTAPPVLKSGTMPSGQRQAGNETVLLQFTVSPTGEVGEIQPLEGQDSTSLPLLTKSLSTWRFTPASNGTVPVAVAGKILFIKGEDKFRYDVSKAFRDSGNPHPPEPKPADVPAGPKSIVTVKVPLRIELQPEEAMKQLASQVPPEYPAEAKAAHIQGTVSMLVTISKDGEVADVKEISGPPALIPAAVAAVKQWRYHPILFRGQPQEARTVVDVPFKLPE